MMRQSALFALLIAVLVLHGSFSSGSADAILVGESASGRTVFKAWVSDLGSLAQMRLYIDGDSMYLTPEKEAVVMDEKLGVFTMSASGSDLNGQYAFLNFYAIPATFKHVEHHRHHHEYFFDAYLSASEPRPDKENRTPKIRLSCRMVYEI